MSHKNSGPVYTIDAITDFIENYSEELEEKYKVLNRTIIEVEIKKHQKYNKGRYNNKHGNNNKKNWKDKYPRDNNNNNNNNNKY